MFVYCSLAVRHAERFDTCDVVLLDIETGKILGARLELCVGLRQIVHHTPPPARQPGLRGPASCWSFALTLFSLFVVRGCAGLRPTFLKSFR